MQESLTTCLFHRVYFLNHTMGYVTPFPVLIAPPTSSRPLIPGSKGNVWHRFASCESNIVPNAL